MAALWCFLLFLGLAMGQGQEKRRTGNTCKVDMDCPDNAFCRLNSFCVCKDGYVYVAYNGTQGCLKEATIGEQCIQHIQCNYKLGLHSECVGGVCSCKQNAHLEGDRCYETAVVGDRCVSDQNCYIGERDVPEYQTYCVRGYCSCQLMYSPRDGGSRCVRDAKLGEICEDELQCSGAGLECRGTCRCRDGWVAHNHSNTCVESVKALGLPCDYDVQCDGLAGAHDAPSPGAALCLGGVCNCSFNSRAAGDPQRCWHKRLPRQECKRDEQCYSEEDEPGYCLSGRCTCKTCSPDAKDFNSASNFKSTMALVTIALVLLMEL